MFFASTRLGTLWLGQGPTASDDSSEVDLAGTSLAGRSAVADLAGGLSFRASGTGALSATTVGGVFNNLDGLGRDDRLRYDTPNFAGFVVSSSGVDGGEWDIGASYGAEFPAFMVAGKISYANQSATSSFPEDLYSGSLSVRHQSGLNATVAAATADDDDSTRDAVTFRYGKLGYIRSIFPVGASYFSIDYGQYDNSVASGDEGDTYGFQFVQPIPTWGTEFYFRMDVR